MFTKNFNIHLPKNSKLSKFEVNNYINDCKKNLQSFKKIFPPFSKSKLLNYEDIWEKIKGYNTSTFMTEMWSEHLEYIKKHFFEEPYNLFHHDIIRYAMYLTAGNELAKKQISYLEKSYSEKILNFYLPEIQTFEHVISNSKYNCSESRIQHLTHLTFAQDKLKIKLNQLNSFVEFGGGYGGMTSLIKRINPNSTILVIDFPIMLLVQMYYYYPIHKENINIMDNNNNNIIEGKINLCPINIVKDINFNPFDLFIATWSLSESNKKTNDIILNELNLFDSKNILYGYRDYGNEKPNPRQMCSKKLPLNKKKNEYDILFDDKCFFALANEHSYLIAKRI